MKDRIKIGVIAGELKQARMLFGFEALQQFWEIEYFAIENPQLLNSFRSSLRLNVFDNLKDMPGYMRTLEERLADCDVLIAMETSQLATFQTLRAALKTHRPCAIIVNEYHPYFYANYANIRAVQVDVFENANQFWPTSKLSSSMLQMEGVAKDKIWVVPPAVDHDRFAVDKQARKKFRDYVKVADDETLVLFHEPLETPNRPMEALNAIRLLWATEPKVAAKTKLLFVGNGGATQELKYRCYDLGLSKSVMFLHQDPEPFVKDMYCASDLVLCLRKEKAARHEDYPSWVLEAMATGAVPIAGSGTIAAEIAQDVGEILGDDTFQAIAQAIAKFAKNHAYLAEESARVVERIKKEFSHQNIAESMKAAISALLAANSGSRDIQADLSNSIADMETTLGEGKNSEALMKIEDLLLRSTDGTKNRSELLRLKGDALSGLHKLEDGMTAYLECLKIDAGNFKAYRGLGYLAFRGHSHEDAMTFFKKALATNDRDELSLFGVGLVHRRLGLNEESLFWLEKCVDLNKSNTKAMTALIQACMECSSTREPIETLNRLIDSSPDSATLTLTLGQLYLRQGQVDLGNEMIAKGLKMQEEERKVG